MLRIKKLIAIWVIMPTLIVLSCARNDSTTQGLEEQPINLAANLTFVIFEDYSNPDCKLSIDKNGNATIRRDSCGLIVETNCRIDRATADSINACFEWRNEKLRDLTSFEDYPLIGYMEEDDDLMEALIMNNELWYIRRLGWNSPKFSEEDLQEEGYKYSRMSYAKYHDLSKMLHEFIEREIAQSPQSRING